MCRFESSPLRTGRLIDSRPFRCKWLPTSVLPAELVSGTRGALAAEPVEAHHSADMRTHTHMKRTRRTTAEQEPMGIVISNGRTDDETPRVFAYVWGPA